MTNAQFNFSTWRNIVKLLSIFLATVISVTMSAGFATAKSVYRTALGVDGCDKCHVTGKEKSYPNPSNVLWKRSKDMSARMADGKGEFSGKKSCNDCHLGKLKPLKL
jgi:hypothetical protein